jgi:hypothetical protein
MMAFQHRSKAAERGMALVFALTIAVILGGLAWALLVMNLGTEKARIEVRDRQRCFWAAEAGLSDAIFRLNNGLIDPRDGLPAFLGTAEVPLTQGAQSYWVEIQAAGSRSLALRSTGLHDSEQERLEVVLARAPTGFFQYAAFGAEGVRLESNAFIDSYDSALGPYEDQVQGGNDFALENGNVGSNGDIVLRSNTEVHGDCQPGPGGIVDDSAPRTYVSGSTDPADEPFPMPPIEVPAIPSGGSVVATSDLVLGPGEVHLDSLLMQGGTTLTLVGPATVVLDDYHMRSGAAMVFDASGGEIELHGTGDFVLESNTDMRTISDSAVDVTIFLSGDNMSAGRRDRIELSSNADFVGAIYAPDISYRLESNFDVYGSIICGELILSSNGEIHFDEALLYDGDGDTVDYDVQLWHELPPQG